MVTGVLYGVGLGPGAPDLITLRAARLIEGAAVVAYPTLAGAASFARAIAADLIAPDAREIVMDVPMSVERAPAQAAYDAGAVQIAAASPLRVRATPSEIDVITPRAWAGLGLPAVLSEPKSRARTGRDVALIAEASVADVTAVKLAPCGKCRGSPIHNRGVLPRRASQAR